MKFTKMQGAGNDFVLVQTSDTQRDWSKLARVICDRHFGIGSDSLILILPSDKADFGMRTFDTDGSEAETCGNGLRCLAKLVFEEGLISPETDRISVETIAGIREVKLYHQDGKLVGIQVGMGKPKFGISDIPVAIEPGKKDIFYIKSMLQYPVCIDGLELQLNLVSMGNPHAIHFCQHPVSDFPLSQLGPKVEYLEIFPNRTNFEVARVINPQQIEVRVWERGVGETLACGSGACAVAVAAQLHGYIGNKVDIKLPGGILQVEWDGSREVMLSGPAEKVFTGEWQDEV
jgi:diaminopimelate epimerase